MNKPAKMPAMSLNQFFLYNCNRGDRHITVNVNGQITDLRKSELEKLTCTFSLPACDKMFKITSGKVEQI